MPESIQLQQAKDSLKELVDAIGWKALLGLLKDQAEEELMQAFKAGAHNASALAILRANLRDARSRF